MESSHCTLNLAPVILTILQSSPSPSGPDEVRFAILVSGLALITSQSGEECGITITVIGPDGEEIPTS